MVPLEPSPDLRRRLQRLSGREPIQFSRPPGGYTPAERWVVRFADDFSAFAKVGATELTAGWLRREHDFYEAVGKRPWLATMLGWDDNTSPLLLLEDLSDAHWPPPWISGHIEQALSAFAGIAATPVPAHFPRLAEFESTAPRVGRGWDVVAGDPTPFLSLGLCSADWLEEALPALVASQDVSLGGDSLLHLDIRSDNLCFTGARTVIVDWNLACTGNPLLDVAFWLPSLQFEGGPPPEAVEPAAGIFAGIVAGFFAARAGLPNVPDAPFVRRVQREQLSMALPWAIRVLSLPPLDWATG